MIILKQLDKTDAEKIVIWNKEKDEKFLHQWAGKKAYTFPISIEQILNRCEFGENEMFTIESDGKTIGTIELGWSDKESNIMCFGRLLIDPNCRAKGYGKVAIQLIEEKAFVKYGASSLELGVYEYNKAAKGLYEKMGYKTIRTEINVSDNSLNSHTMIKHC